MSGPDSFRGISFVNEGDTIRTDFFASGGIVTDFGTASLLLDCESESAHDYDACVILDEDSGLRVVQDEHELQGLGTIEVTLSGAHFKADLPIICQMYLPSGDIVESEAHSYEEEMFAPPDEAPRGGNYFVDFKRWHTIGNAGRIGFFAAPNPKLLSQLRFKFRYALPNP